MQYIIYIRNYIDLEVGKIFKQQQTDIYMQLTFSAGVFLAEWKESAVKKIKKKFSDNKM